MEFQSVMCGSSEYSGHPRCNIIYDFLYFILLLFRFRLHHRHCFAIVMSAVRYYTGDEPNISPLLNIEGIRNSREMQGAGKSCFLGKIENLEG